MSWFDWLLIGGLAVLFVLALRHIIRQAKKGRCCGCSGCSGCEGCPSRSGCEEGLGRLEHEEDADSGRSLPPDAAPVERLNKNTRKKRAAEGSRRLPAGKQLPAAPVRKNADAGGRFRWKMREGLGGSDHD
ncbi:MAG: hypothetical protein ACLS9N_09700 [[Clostridium] leptum]